MIKPWEMGKSEVLAKGFGKELRRVMFTNPTTQSEEEFYLFGQRDWSIVLPITEDGMVLAVRQYKQGCNKIVVELPAGTTNFKDEDPETVAARELLEETGYQAEKMIFLGPPQWMASRNSWTRFFPFVAFGCKKVKEAKMDSSEEIETLLIPYKEWLEICQSQIEDPSVIVATFRAMKYCQMQG